MQGQLLWTDLWEANDGTFDTFVVLVAENGEVTTGPVKKEEAQTIYTQGEFQTICTRYLEHIGMVVMSKAEAERLYDADREVNPIWKV